MKPTILQRRYEITFADGRQEIKLGSRQLVLLKELFGPIDYVRSEGRFDFYKVKATDEIIKVQVVPPVEPGTCGDGI